MILFLIGYMGAGKSCVGREVSKKTGFRFLDMDTQVEHRCGLTVSEIFAQHGEAYFRKLEREVLDEFTQMEGDFVISTGGGVPCFEDNMERMNGMGETIYLKLSPRVLVTRLEHGREKRPIIRGMNDRELLAFIERTLATREAYYARARMTIDCDRMSIEDVSRHILDFIGRFGK